MRFIEIKRVSRLSFSVLSFAHPSQMKFLGQVQMLLLSGSIRQSRIPTFHLRKFHLFIVCFNWKIQVYWDISVFNIFPLSKTLQVSPLLSPYRLYLDWLGFLCLSLIKSQHLSLFFTLAIYWLFWVTWYPISPFCYHGDTIQELYLSGRGIRRVCMPLLLEMWISGSYKRWMQRVTLTEATSAQTHAEKQCKICRWRRRSAYAGYCWGEGTNYPCDLSIPYLLRDLFLGPIFPREKQKWRAERSNSRGNFEHTRKLGKMWLVLEPSSRNSAPSIEFRSSHPSFRMSESKWKSGICLRSIHTTSPISSTRAWIQPLGSIAKKPSLI